MAVELINVTSGNKVAVNASGEMAVAPTRTHANAGFVVLAGEVHDGATGPARLTRKIGVSPNGYSRVGLDSLLWRDTFNHAVVQNDAYQVSLTTMTTAMTGGYWVLNSGNALTAAAVARVQTYRTFEVFGLATVSVVARVRWAADPVTNSVAEFGLGYATTTTTPTDGVYFKQPSSGGVLTGVVNLNGVESTVNLVTTPQSNVVYELRIRIDEDEVNFFVNGVLEGVIARSATAPAVGFCRAWPLLVRLYNAGALSTTQRLEVGEVTVLQNEIPLPRTAAAVATGGLMHSSNVQRGTATAQTANYANSAAPASATLSNTAGGYTVLHGQWQFAAVAGAETDYALFAYSVPAASVTGGNRSLWVTNVMIEAFNTGAAVATTPTLLQWALGLGSTAQSLATADGTGTRAPRRIPLGVQSFAVGAAVGAKADKVDYTPAAPLLVEPNTFLHLILKMPVATATASQIVRGIYRVDGYWE